MSNNFDLGTTTELVKLLSGFVLLSFSALGFSVKTWSESPRGTAKTLTGIFLLLSLFITGYSAYSLVQMMSEIAKQSTLNQNQQSVLGWQEYFRSTFLSLIVGCIFMTISFPLIPKSIKKASIILLTLTMSPYNTTHAQSINTTPKILLIEDNSEYNSEITKGVEAI